MKKFAIHLFFLVAWFISTHAQTTRHYNVYLRSNVGEIILWDDDTTRIFGFASLLMEEPKLPAKILYAEEGDSVVLNATSISQGEHHTIHLHGTDADTRNDGDPATSFWLSHMQDTTYSFLANHAGTYLYHCHVGDVVHVQMGMYGLIVVKAAGGAHTAWTGGPAFDKEYKWLMSEIDKSWHDNIPVHDTVNDLIVIPEYRPDYFLVNGKSRQQITADDSIAVTSSAGSYIYLRLANIGFYDNRVIFPAFLNAQVIDSDGRPLPQYFFSDTIEVSPGERYGVMLHPTIEFTDTVMIQYLNLNTGIAEATEKVTVTVSGFIGMNDTESFIENTLVYPNPAAYDVITVACNNTAIKAEYAILNLLGQTLVNNTIPIEKGLMKINISSLAGGTYFLKIIAGNQTTVSKIIKQ